MTGASLGIGRAVAEELAARDATSPWWRGQRIRCGARRTILREPVAGVYLRCRRMRPCRKRYQRGQQASQELGGSIDILVNNAGSTPEDGIDQVDFAKWQYSIALKQFGYARFAQRVLPAMRAQKWGRIVNVIGRSGHQPRPVYLAGGAVNAGLLNFTKALAEDAPKTTFSSLA